MPFIRHLIAITAWSQSVPENNDEVPPLGFAIAQLKGIYILSESQQGMILVDMHAAHERIVYERMKKSFSEDSILSQPLLVPLNLSLSEKETRYIQDNTPLFVQLGFDIDVAAAESAVIRAVPALLQKADVALLIRDVLDLIANGVSQRIQRRLTNYSQQWLVTVRSEQIVS